MLDETEIIYVFVINPVAGTKDAGEEIIPQIKAAEKQLGITAEIKRTSCPGDAKELAKQYLAQGKVVHIYSCGGDGTLNEIIQTAAGQKNIAVGCIPCGSGNDFIRNFGTASDFLNIPAQLGAQTETIDLIETNYGYGAAICAAGLDAKVAYGIPKFRRLPGCGGTMAYTLSIIQVLFSRFGHHLRIQIDGNTIEGSYMMMAVCNGREYGGGYKAGALAVMDDGLLDVVLVKPISRLQVPDFLAHYKVGEHLNANGNVTEKFRSFMQFYRAKEINVEVLDGNPLIITVDGECRPTKHLHAKISEKKLNILLPEAVIGRTTALSKIEGCFAAKQV